MTRLYLAGGLLSLVLILGGLVWWQGQRLEARKTEIENLKAEVVAAAETARIEYRTQTIVRKVTVESEKAKADVKAAPDPECANPDPVLDAWRAGIERVREAASAPDGTGDGA